MTLPKWKIEVGPMPTNENRSLQFNSLLTKLTTENHGSIFVRDMQTMKGTQMGLDSIRAALFLSATNLGFKIKTRSKNGYLYVEKSR